MGALGLPRRRTFASTAQPMTSPIDATDVPSRGAGGHLAALLDAQGVAVLDGGLGSLLPDEKVAGTWSVT